MIKRALLIIYSVITIVLVAVIIAFSLSPAYNALYFFNPLVVTDEVEYSINGSPKSMLKLPDVITGLEPGDEVSVFLQSSGRAQDNLLIVADKAHCVLSIGNEQYFSIGGEGTYPEFQKEPPQSIDIVSLPRLNEGTELRLTYTLSSIGTSLKIVPFLSGDHDLIAERIITENLPAFVLSLVMLAMGGVLSIVGLAFYSRAELAIVLFWLGITCFITGLWAIFANFIVLLVFNQATTFYTISLISLYVLPIPLGRFCITFLKPYRSRLLDGIFVAICVFLIAAVTSHISGFISFGQIEPVFKIVSPMIIGLFAFYIFLAKRKPEGTISTPFLIGSVLLAVLTATGTLFGYLGIIGPTGSFFMVGLFIAAVAISLYVWEYLNNAFAAMEKNARLESDISAINRSLDLQRKHFQDLTQSVEETRRMRHDMRHQLVVIQGFIDEKKNKEALEYIDNLAESIPSRSEMLVCENVAVNSLAVHYIARAEEKHILCDVQMAVPSQVGCVPDGDLSIIVGNLFENAIEACLHVEPDKRFIRVRSTVIASRFTLIIDNSFDGELFVSGSDFFSRKRKGFGVGIASVRSVIRKYNGGMKHETESGVFKTSLYVKI